MSNSNQVTFTDIAANDGAGIAYRRHPSASDAKFTEIKGVPGEPTYGFPEVLETPIHSRGVPGVAIFDFDNDGDEDIYVTNGPGANNSLYSNQLTETGSVEFFDVAVEAGVGVADQDSTGVCYGDIDNDGDLDLLVLGNSEPNRLFENQGDGTFIDISDSSGVSTGHAASNSCSMGDVNNDGLLDIVIANAFDMSSQSELFVTPFEQSEPNQLLLNRGDNTFADVTETSGLLDVFLPDDAPFQVPDEASTVTWAIAMVDYDGDGDIDIMHSDDQGPFENTLQGGVDRGFNQLFQNDGTGNFTNVTAQVGLNTDGGWMALSYGDFNQDGLLDFFGSNFGNYAEALFSPELDFEVEQSDSRWFLQNPDGTFSDFSDQELIHTPFGWGTSAVDYDNDSDTDIIFHGGLDLGPLVITSPGAILNNDGSANFQRDTVALANSTDHVRRIVHGVATGDLNNDGFVDIVSASNFDVPEPFPIVQSPQLSSEWDIDAFFVPTFTLEDPEDFLWSWNGFEFPDGTLSVEVNNAENQNNWVQVDLLGTVGLTSSGMTNRDGIGALVSFQAGNSPSVDMRPILGGSSYASQDSLVATFGLGEAERGVVEVLWSGGVRNRLYDVEADTRLVFPEIPVSFDGDFEDINDYQSQVDDAIGELVIADVFSRAESEKFFASSIQAYLEERDIFEAVFFGGVGDDKLVGKRADESFYGRGGDDVIVGERGDDTIFGGAGDDTLRGDRNNGNPRNNQGGDDIIYGGKGNDRIRSRSGNDQLFGEEGDDLIVGGRGDDTIFGGAGDDILRGDYNNGNPRNNQGGDDIIYGGKGNDRIRGRSGNDQLFGDEGNDSLSGDNGDDILRGGLGNDRLTGDKRWGRGGSDTFVLAADEGTDIITDFEVGIDVIGLAGGLRREDLFFQGNKILLGNETLAILRNGIIAVDLTPASFILI